MADPGFPVGGAPTHWGGANLRHAHFLVKMYVKMKEIDPVGGARAGGTPLDPPMDTDNFWCIVHSGTPRAFLNNLILHLVDKKNFSITNNIGIFSFL